MKSIVFASAIAAATATIASADVITSYINFGQPGDQIASPTGTVAPNVSALPLTRGAGLNPNVGANSLNSAGWNGGNPDDYITFGFTVADGYRVNLESLFFGGRSSGSGPGDLGVFSSLDGFAAPLHTYTQTGTAFTNNAIDLSALSGLTGAVEFRIYATSDRRADGTFGISSAGTYRVGDYSDGAVFSEFRFEGRVKVIPTPGAAALLAVGGIFAARRRRA